MSGEQIVIDKLSKRYRKSDNWALSGLTLTVGSGEVYGFLGPNGAGKSTTIRTLLNFLQPTKGSASILGLDIVKDSVAIRQHIGYLSGDMAMYRKMTGAQYLEYLSELLAPSSKAYRSELTKRLGCSLHKPLGELSRGNRQKIALVQAFMSQPKVLILDEPTSGLDPLMQEVFYELVAEAKQRGASVFMSSHVLAEVQKVCDRVGIIRSGKLIAERSIADMTREAAQTFTVEFAAKPPLGKLKKLNGLSVLDQHGNVVTLRLRGDIDPLIKLLAAERVVGLVTRELDIEELFMHYYEDES